MTRPHRHNKGDRLMHSGAKPEEIACDFALGPFDTAARNMERNALWGDVFDSQSVGGMIGFKRAERCYQHQPGPDHNRPLEGPTMADSKPICSVAGCGNISYLKNLCQSHYQRNRRHGTPTGGGVSWGVPVRWLEALVAAPPDHCVEWPFASNGNGYGWASYKGQRFGSHRLSLFLATGELPPGMVAAHSCHNRACVNPKHLSWKSSSANSVDRRKDGTSGKLSPEDVEAIRGSTDSGVALAERFGVTPSAISKLRKGRFWK